MTLTVRQAAERLGVTYRRVYCACMRGEIPYNRDFTHIFIQESDMDFLKDWFSEQDRMKEKEVAIGKYDLSGRRVLREMAQSRIREGDDAAGQAGAQGPPG